MKFIKNGIVFNAISQIQADAFRSSGYEEMEIGLPPDYSRTNNEIYVKYTESELQEISSKEIKRIAEESGYILPPSPPASKEELISVFMKQQEMK